uniref:Uncharacterized protein n=1 Tax=Varanus komodoensis TaxID=61221 RepID=A0A8D2IXK7_VARKO
MSRNPNYYRTLSSYTLHNGYFHSIFLSIPHLPRHSTRMTSSKLTCQRGIPILPLHLYPHWPRHLSRIISSQKNLICWHFTPPSTNSYSLHRLYSTLRADITLRRNRNHQPSLNHSVCWNNPSRMNLGRIFSGQCYPHPLLYPSFPPTIYHHRNRPSPHYTSPRNRI